MTGVGNDATVRKRDLRRRLQADRLAREPADRDQQTARLASFIDDHADVLGGVTIAAYVPLAEEPGRVDLLDRMFALGVTVLLPVTGRRSDPLRWGRYLGGSDLRSGPLGLLQPVADPAVNLLMADHVVVPAMAVDPAGYRLGKGAGLYDRALVGVPRERTTALVYDEEALLSVPREQHDVPVGWIITPGCGRRRAFRD